MGLKAGTVCFLRGPTKTLIIKGNYQPCTVRVQQMTTFFERNCSMYGISSISLLILYKGKWSVFDLCICTRTSITQVTTDNGRDFSTMADLTFNEYQASITMVEQIKEMLLPVNSNKKLFDGANINFRQTQ